MRIKSPTILLLVFTILARRLSAQSHQQNRPEKASIRTTLGTHVPRIAKPPLNPRESAAARIVARVVKECGPATSFQTFCSWPEPAAFIQLVCENQAHAKAGSGLRALDFGPVLSLTDKEQRETDAVKALLYLASCEPSYNAVASSLKITRIYDNQATVSSELANATVLQKLLFVIVNPDRSRYPTTLVKSGSHLQRLIMPEMNSRLGTCGAVALDCTFDLIVCFSDATKAQWRLHAIRAHLSGMIQRVCTAEPMFQPYVLRSFDSLKQSLAGVAEKEFRAQRQFQESVALGREN